MTVTASPRKAGPYTGNGVTTAFPFLFKIFADADVQPVLTDSTGAATNLVLNSDYTVLRNSDQDANPGGTVTYPIGVGPAPMPASSTLTLIGNLAYDQTTDITNGGRFLPQVIENAFDRAVILIQQLKEVSDRTLQAAVGTTVKLLFPAPSSGKFIRWRSDLAGLENAEAGTDSLTLQGLLADATSAAHGAGMLGLGNALTYPASTVGAALTGANATFKGRATGAGSGQITDLTPAQARTTLNGTEWSLSAGTGTFVQVLSSTLPQPPGLTVYTQDSLVLSGGQFYLGSQFIIDRNGGSGNREAATARITSNNAPQGEFAVGMHGYARIQTGGGNAAGLNGYAWVDAAASNTAEAMGAEMNTDVRRSIVRKVGVQVIDVATSVGSGTVYDAGILIGSQAGGAGYSVGIRFGLDGTTGFGMLNNGTLIAAQTSNNALRAGLDLSGLSNFSAAPILLRPNTKGIWWGTAKEGGSVISETSANGPVISFLNQETQIRTSTGALNFSSTSEDTTSRFRTGADGASVVRRIIAGAADSGGTGYRTLRVEN